MDSPALPVYLAGPFPVVFSAHREPPGPEVALDIALIMGGLPSIIASTRFPMDEGWDRIEAALTSGDARLGVAGLRHDSESPLGMPESFPSAYIGLECANGERLVVAHIRGFDSEQDPERYALAVIQGLQQGHSLTELGEALES